MRKEGCPFGTHRVISPANVLPQTATKLDNSLPIYSNEMLIEVDTLNIDSASFRQIEEACHHDIPKIKQMIMGIVAERGKQQNPVTGSGGMLLGSVKELGPDFPASKGFKIGQRIATLVSLSLTPLFIEEIIEVFPKKDQVKIKGYAILFASGVATVIPEDLHEKLALAVLDVAGAPAQAMRLVKPHQTVVIIGGGGKSGSLCGAVARDLLGKTGKLIAIEYSPKGVERLEKLGYYDQIVVGNAQNPVECMQAIKKATDGQMADLVINCASVENTEMASIMSAKNTGTVYFFSMATSFTKAALGAEGIGSDAMLIIGNGYAENHANIAIDVIRRHPEIRELFEKVYI